MTQLNQLKPEQRNVLNTILTTGRQRRVSFPELVAAVSTGLVEANLGNPNYGDGTSRGWRQETASSYPNVNRQDVKGSVNRFFNETAQNRGSHPNYASLAQSVQRSAFPGRYAQRGEEAKGLIRQWAAQNRGSAPKPAAQAQTAAPVTQTVTPAVDNSKARQALMLNYLDQRNQKGSLLSLASGLKSAQDTPAVTKTTQAPARGAPAAAPAQAGYVHPVGGKFTPGRTDNGVDYETVPGTALRAVGSGKIVNTNGNFPGTTVVLQLDHPYRDENGRVHSYVYYGHLNGGLLVRPGQRVSAGQAVARSSQSPAGASNMPGHVEIGWARDASGTTQTGAHAPGALPWGISFNNFVQRHASR